MSGFRKVGANIVDELAGIDTADMIEDAVNKSSKIVRRPSGCCFPDLPLNSPEIQPLLRVQGITA